MVHGRSQKTVASIVEHFLHIKFATQMTQQLVLGDLLIHKEDSLISIIYNGLVAMKLYREIIGGFFLTKHKVNKTKYFCMNFIFHLSQIILVLKMESAKIYLPCK